MSFVEEVKKRISKKKQEKIEFGMLLSIIKNKRSRNIKQVRNYLDNEIKKCRTFLAKNKTYSTINSKRREYTKRLGEFVKIKKLLK